MIEINLLKSKKTFQIKETKNKILRFLDFVSPLFLFMNGFLFISAGLTDKIATIRGSQLILFGLILCIIGYRFYSNIKSVNEGDDHV